MKLLYITFISLEDIPTSGSSVRPQKMRNAFKETGHEVVIIDGMNNNLSARKNAVKRVKKLIKTWVPEACYIEPPSGPMFYYGDVQLIKFLHKKRVPISIFYRDAYWKYPEFAKERTQSFVEKLKSIIIRRMQIHQWNVFRKYIDIIYFPSKMMAKEFDCPHKDVLPPGGFVPEFKEKAGLSDPIQFIFVGGAAQNYGTYLTISAFDKVNEDSIKAKVFYICPEEQWNSLGIDKEKYKDWLEIIHTSGDENLKPYYEKADLALLTAPRSFYRDFAVPIKIYEYMSYLKPVLVTNCTETERIVKDNHIGWVVEDSTEAVAAKVEYLCEHTDEVLEVRAGMERVRSNNLWASRAQKVIKDLEGVKEHGSYL